MKKIFLAIASLFFLFSIVSGQVAHKSRPKIGLVLSGGGAKGLAHIGVLKVLEMEGIPIDYIGGTSMGSIIGGLYAIGYSAQQLDSITRSIDWEKLLADKVSRENLSMVEKDEGIRYMISFPIRGKRISLPSGIATGQNISSTFTDLCSPVYNTSDFSKFTIPYLCVASDIKTGQAVVLQKGNLPEAMRASMAIPTVFTPEHFDNKALLDGGMVNNFPVEEVINMGADIIIGVDVGYNYDRIDENPSLVSIIEQSIFMHSREQNIKSRSKCRVLILPELEGYNTSSFGHTDSLITLGEKATIKNIVEIRQLAALLRDSFQWVKPDAKRHLDKITKYNIQQFEIEGLNKIPREFILRKMPFKIPGSIEISDIEKFIQVIYGTQFFERVTYAISADNVNGVKLTFKVQEKSTNYFRAGLHYDNDYKATLTLNTTFRNLISKGSKVSVDLALGENPSLSLLYYKNSGWNPKYSLFFWSKYMPDYGLRIQTHNLEVYEFNNEVKTASLGFVDVTTEFFAQRNISNNQVYGLGIVSDFTSVNSRISSSKAYDQDSYHFYLKGYYQSDSYNEAFFPTKGNKINAEVKYVKGFSANVKNEKAFLQANVRANFIQPISRKVSLREGIYGGITFADTLSSPYWFYMGGMAMNTLRNLMPFVGLDFMQRAGNHMLLTRFDVQWEMWDNNFLTFKTNIGKATRIQKNLISPDDIVVGYGASFGYRSPIGPIEVTLMSSNKKKDLSVFFSIGYMF